LRNQNDSEAKKKTVEWSGDHDTNAWHAEPEADAGDDAQDSLIEARSEFPDPLESLASDEDASDEDASDEDDEADADEVLAAEGEGDEERAPTNADADSRRRSKTIARKQMMRERRRMIAQGLIPEVVEYDRPSTRAQCRDGDRPCLYVACRYHLYLDVNPNTGSIKINFPDKEVWELEETCALDVAERGGITLEEVGDIMNLTRERIRQVEVSGLQKLRDGDVSLETFMDGREL
jgi:hypothetical protein